MSDDFEEYNKDFSKIRKEKEEKIAKERREDIIKAIKETPSIVNERNEVLRKRKNKEYDGVLGTPPKWVPKNILLKFEDIRDYLLDYGYSHQQLLIWIDRKINPPELKGGEYIRDVFFDPSDDRVDKSISDDISFLAVIYTASQKGEKEGLPLLIDEAIASYAAKGKEQESNLRTKGYPAAAEKKNKKTQEKNEKCQRAARGIWWNNQKLSYQQVRSEVRIKTGLSASRVDKALRGFKKIVRKEKAAEEQKKKEFAWGSVLKRP